MPLQKGKKRKRPRRRSETSASLVTVPVTAPDPAPARGARPARRRMELPWWLYFSMSVFLIISAIYLAASPQKNFNTVEHVVIVAGYLGLAAFWFSKGLRLYRAR